MLRTVLQHLPSITERQVASTIDFGEFDVHDDTLASFEVKAIRLKIQIAALDVQFVFAGCQCDRVRDAAYGACQRSRFNSSPLPGAAVIRPSS